LQGHDLGYFDEAGKRVEPVADPFGTKLLPMSPEWTLPAKIKKAIHPADEQLF
jgi:hypothetical protein